LPNGLSAEKAGGSEELSSRKSLPFGIPGARAAADITPAARKNWRRD